MKSQPWYDKLSGILTTILNVTASFLFLLSVLVAAYEVLMRYAFNDPHDWGEEVVVTIMLYAIFLAAAVGLKQGRLTRIDVLLVRMGEKKLLIWEIFLSVVTTITCGAYTWSAVDIVLTLKQNGLVTPTTLAIPCWFRYLVFPVSLGLCTLVGIEQIAKRTAKLVSAKRYCHSHTMRVKT